MRPSAHRRSEEPHPWSLPARAGGAPSGTVVTVGVEGDEVVVRA